jgi:hypothetical protein
MPDKRKSPLSIFIPISILSDVPSLMEKTFKVGQIARSAAIYRVDRIVIYGDSPSANKSDAFIIRDLLSYAETPQYLRKRLFPLQDTLRYAGLIPPLRTSHHPLESTETPYREGLVLTSSSRGSRVDIGLKKPVDCRAALPVNRRVPMKSDGDSWIPTTKADIPIYWGYDVALEFKRLSQLIASSGYGSVLVTSRLGRPIESVISDYKRLLAREKTMALVFGSPSEGVHEILARDSKSPQEVADLVVNTIPDQGTATVRTEEAVAISLAVLTLIEFSP